MKLSLAATLLIAVAALLLGWRQERRIDATQDSNDRLASRLGLLPGGAVSTSTARDTKRQREPRPDVGSLAARLIAIFSKPEAERGKETGDLPERLASLNRDEFRQLFESLRGQNQVDAESRREAVGYAFYRFVMSRPQDALSLLVEFPDSLGDGGQRKQDIIHTGLYFWSMEEPDAALAWFRENQNKTSDLGRETAKSFLVSGIAGSDPRLAFQLFEEFGLPVDQLGGVLSVVKMETIAIAVSALRGYAESRSDPAVGKQAMEAGLVRLAQRIPSQDFQSAAGMIAAAKLSPTEMEIFASRLEVARPEDSGRWIDWFAENLPQEKADPKIRWVVRQWAFGDYQAAAEWLESVPPGPTRDNAVRAYAEAVAPYQPERAARQAMTLPAGPARQETLLAIFRNWPPNDAPAKAAFGQAHGLE